MTKPHEQGMPYPENDDLTSDQWREMYFAQCSLTDSLSKQVASWKARKSDSALKARIAELENDLAKVNAILATINDAADRKLLDESK